MADDGHLARSFPGSPAVVDRLKERARDYIQASKSESTRRAYSQAWRDFENWCEVYSRSSLPANGETLALYVTDMADRPRSISTVQLAIAAIASAHRSKGLASPSDDPRLRFVWDGIRRIKTCAPRQKAPVSSAEIEKMIRVLPSGMRGVRDRAIILLGFSGGFRRSEISALDFDDVEFVAEGAQLNLRRSKTDQEGIGRIVGIPSASRPNCCPVDSIRMWLAARGSMKGAMFFEIDWHERITEVRMSGRAVARAVKRYGAAIGIDPESLGGHSLRSGFATEAARNGATEASIMAQTGHRSLAIVRRYIRLGTVWHNNAARYLGL